MRSIVMVLLLTVCSSAFARDTVSYAHAKSLLAWNHVCDQSSSACWLEKLVTFKSKAGVEQGGVAIAYDRKMERPQFIAVIVPGDVPLNSNLLIRFLDSVKINGAWTLVPVGDFVSLPLSGCDKSSCQAQIHPQVPGGPDLFKQIRKRRFAWVMFKRNGALERFMVPLSGVDDALRSIQ